MNIKVIFTDSAKNFMKKNSIIFSEILGIIEYEEKKYKFTEWHENLLKSICRKIRKQGFKGVILRKKK